MRKKKAQKEQRSIAVTLFSGVFTLLSGYISYAAFQAIIESGQLSNVFILGTAILSLAVTAALLYLFINGKI